MGHPIRVLFLCTGNSTRAHMAEGLLRSLGGGDFEVYSASADAQAAHPLAVQAMREIRIDIGRQKSNPLELLYRQSFDHVIAICDRARNHCPALPDETQRVCWGFADPAAVTGSEDEQRAAFRKLRGEIAERLRLWVTIRRRAVGARAASGAVTPDNAHDEARRSPPM